MATVEQCESQPSGLSSISNTLHIFDTFKPSQEEEKDSDEESFHLPMLDCDEDLETNNKETLMNETSREMNNGETEDDILNKFETNGTPDMDPKIEDSILNEIDNLLEKKLDDSINNKDISCSNEVKDQRSPKEESSNNPENKNDTNSAVLKTSEIIDNYIDSLLDEKEPKINEEVATAYEENKDTIVNITEKEKMALEDEKIINTDVGMVNEKDIDNKKTENDDASQDIQVHDLMSDGKMDLASKDDTQLSDEVVSNDIVKIAKSIANNTDDDFSELNTFAKKLHDIETPVVKDQERINNLVENNECTSKFNPDLLNMESKVSTSTDLKIDNCVEPEAVQEDNREKKDSKPDYCLEGIQEDNKIEKDVQLNSCVEAAQVDIDIRAETDLKTDNCMENVHLDKKENDLKTDYCLEGMEVDDGEEKGVAKEDKLEETSEDILNEGPSMDDSLADNSNQCTTGKVTEHHSSGQENNDKVAEKQLLESATESMDQEESAAVDDIIAQNDVEPDKCENSNDSSKSQNLECEDLLDISIIRDADEDNASAIAENANDAQTSDKSDNDNDDQDEGSDKAENELDESEVEQDDSLLVNDKDDNMDFEDGSSNLCDQDQDNIISESTSDSDIKGNSEIRDSENESTSALIQKGDDVELSSEQNQIEEENIELKDINNDTMAEENQDSPKEKSTKSSGKRSLSEADIADGSNKKIKLSERSKTEEKISAYKNNKVKTLISFEKYMQNKKLENKLTRSDLEQFCLQKICEAIIHKTDVGELHQTIKKQEQIIENLRKDLQQLTKQARDLDIVNKKLMNELKSQNGTKKPLVPLKITRSVGLQVKLNSTSTEVNNRRKVVLPTTPRTPTNNNTNARPRTITPANTAVVRQVAASPRKTPTAAPLLSQALQSRQVTPANTVTKRTPIRPKPAEPQKPANSSVIDLTDEDDKASKGVVGNSVKILNKTIPLSQGKTINIIPAKTVPNKINSNQSKTVAIGQVKSTSVGAKVGTSTRTVATLPQGVRLTPTQVKNGSIAIPASVVTSNSGTTQFMYVVQPGSVVTSTAGGTQKAVLLNFQPTNGVLTSTINGSAVSVLPSKTSNTVQLKTVTASRKHPAPLPSPSPTAVNASLKPLLPKPHLSIRKTDTGIILQWRMPYNLDIYEAIASYQLFAYQETSAPPSTDMWRKVGDVKALALPMACTLTQFADKNKYYFAVRSVDVHKRIGAFSDPEEISL